MALNLKSFLAFTSKQVLPYYIWESFFNISSSAPAQNEHQNFENQCVRNIY